MDTKPPTRAERPAPAKQADSKDNRRNFFRINHDILFDCRPVDTFTANSATPEEAFDDSAVTGLVAELRRLDRDAAQKLKILAEKDHVLGDYLQLLSSKIDLIARQTLLAKSAPDAHVPTRINLSEAGIAFKSDRAYYKGTFLIARLIFLPSYIPVVVFAEVIRCQNKANPNGDNEDNLDSYDVAARFHRLSEKDRQELSRQIIKAQVAHRVP